ncbi:winged helix-turn-helix transcriptional regulator [Candidatus Bathyarchaeota archaeon]|nr:winged helix-turn-helix transcriptional regulator [Candidatus Bathyarchaeota archaeon]
MDKTDVILSLLLLANSRLSYRELADTLNLSVTAVHNRIQSLIEAGIIRKFTAKVSILASMAIHVLIFGTSETSSLHDLRAKLEKHGSIYWLAVAGGNYLYIGAYLRNISELEALVNYIKEVAEIREPIVGITSSPLNFPIATLDKIDTRLYKLDYQIINSLKDDSRKATADVAEELKVSAKTVRRRLSRMIEDHLIELSIEWYPDASNDIITAFHVRLKPEAEKNTADMLVRKYSPNVMFYWGFSNIPNSYLFLVWTGTTKELRDMRERFECEAAVQSVAPNVIFTGYIFNIWRDQIPKE